MNWSALKEKYPNSAKEIRVFANQTKVTDSRAIIELYLRSKGFKYQIGFIHQLKRNENNLQNQKEQQ